MPLNSDGSVACLFLPMRYEDGDAMHVFIEQVGENLVRFSDGGDVLTHFAGRGIDFSDVRRMRFIKNAAEPTGVAFNEAGELEVFAKNENAGQGFASLLHTLTRIKDWEVATFAAEVDEVAYLDEVEYLLRMAYPSKRVGPSRTFTGITGQIHTLSFTLDDEDVLAVQSHHASVSAAIKKMLDIKANPANEAVKTLVVLDDRKTQPRSGGLGESALFQTFGPVIDFTRLKARADQTTTH